MTDIVTKNNTLPRIVLSSSSDPEVSKQFISDLKVNFEKFALESESVFVIGHNNPDLDSIGSAAAFAYAAEILRRHKHDNDLSYVYNPESVYVVVDDLPFKLDASVRKLMADKCASIRFINKHKCLSLMTKNDLLLVTDVNQGNRIALGDSLDRFGNVLVVDHHDTNAGTMNANQLFIDTSKSSACEIAYRVLTSLGIKTNPEIATAILAGINLDTTNYTQKRTPSLMSLIARLMNRESADDSYILKLRQSDLYADTQIHDIISSNIHEGIPVLYEMSQTDSVPEVDEIDSLSIKSTVGFVLNREQSNRIVLSKVANELRDYSDVSFAIGRIDEGNKISIHARSNGKIHVGKLMESFGGGGNAEMASAQLDEDSSLEDVKERVLILLPLIKPMERIVK